VAARRDFSYEGQFYKANHVTILPRPACKKIRAAESFMAAALNPEESFCLPPEKKGHSIMAGAVFFS